jgi:hypothetical protein
MKELNDYSGKLKPDLKLKDFSEDALRRLFRVGGDLYIGMAERYNALIKEKLGEEKAIEFSTEVWMNRGGCDDEMRLNREAMNIWGDDIESVFKYLQIDCGVTPRIQFVPEIKNKNLGIITVTNCYWFDKAIKEGRYQDIKHACEVLDVQGFNLAARAFNPRMKATPLKLPQIPPQKSDSAIVCQWEFKIE